MKIVISAGEYSGDEHGGMLARALKSLAPDVQLCGMGGRHLRNAGMELVVDAEKSGNAMGFGEIASKLGDIRASLKVMEELLKSSKPDRLVLIDYPDFNLRLAKIARALGIHTTYFIIPKMWVWRSGRLKHFEQYIDCACAIFPFEQRWMQSRGYLRCHYVGHPFASVFRALPPVSREETLSKLGLNPQAKTIALLPGSRGQELKLHAPLARATIEELLKRDPKVQVLIPAAPTVQRHPLMQPLMNLPSTRVTDISSTTVMRVADAGLIKSGTSTLQAVFCNLPSVMFFKAHPISAWIVRTFIKKSDYSLPNIVRPGSMREIIQEEATSEILAQAALGLLQSPEREQVLAQFREVRELLGASDSEPQDAYANTARLVVSGS